MKEASISRSLLILALAATFAVSAQAQKKPTQAPASPQGQTMPRGFARGGMEAPSEEPKKYEDVITKEAKTQPGVFKVHQVKDKIYWEIPSNMLGRDFLWQTEIAQLPHSAGFPGSPMGTKVVRFTRHNNTIFLRDVNYDTRAVGDNGTIEGVKENTINPIVMTFPVVAEAPDKSTVIDVTSLFTSDPSEFSVASRLGAAGVDTAACYIDRVKAFPQNIETRSFLTFGAGPSGMGGLPARRGFGFGRGGGAVTALVHYSLDLLPETPMRGRLKDSRIGYFTSDFYEYGTSENRAVEKRYIHRFRLEKKDPNAAVSDVVKPIVFYLPKEVPMKWRPYLKQGIDDWQPVFEKIGFKNAITCEDAPANADWDAEDARYNVVRWAPSQTENARGASIQDPRSGETLSAHVIIWNDLMKLLEDWDFAQTAAADPTSRSFPYSDEKMGEMLRYVICHEVGHTLGLEHNFKASVAYSIQQLRDPEFMKTHGTSASIMSYSRNDYVAQPGDGVTEYANRIGPYDYFAIEYGYKPIPHTISPEDEKPALDALLAEQVDHPELRFGNYLYPGIDPGMQSENVSSDPVQAAKLGLRNLSDIADNYLLPACSKFGEDYTKLDEMESNLLQQHLTELLHIVPLVGGVVQTDYHAGRGADVFTPVPRAKQAEAVKYLTTEGFEPPMALVQPKIMNRLQPDGLVEVVANEQRLILSLLLSNSRIDRMTDNEAANGAAAYRVSDLVSAVSDGVWKELLSGKPAAISVYRRALQRDYLNTVDAKVNGFNSKNSDLCAYEKDDLRHVARLIDRALPHTADRETYAHLTDCRKDIERILDNKYSSESGGGALDLSFLLGVQNGQTVDDDPEGCWTPGVTIRAAIKEVEDEEKKEK